jgi:methionyl-tRNA formyltransferase
MKRDLRIIFMGTPQFAVPSLKSLIDNGFNVVGVITAPDKPAGRGREIKFSEVKQFAVKAKLPLLQPVNLKDNKFIKEFAALKPNLGMEQPEKLAFSV